MTDLKEGDIVKHKLTKEEFIVVFVDQKYIVVRGKNYEKISMDPSEVEKK